MLASGNLRAGIKEETPPTVGSPSPIPSGLFEGLFIIVIFSQILSIVNK